ncbi:ornithine carbamoyltransferase [uncultured Gulosibacter sp.]|uniref:ornithine carbamoyltransferase n=1 Tax=uncultured Gulosibacter sp. TaxID=1339167 RepID=UPI00288B26AF|nr:ornithine carbamoyltransferase [uncultured Gulosibacter sp.]
MIRHFLRDDDVTPAEQAEILDLAERLKRNRFAARSLEGPKSVAVIFDKSSTRTRVSFHVGISELGGSPLIFTTATSQLGGKETPADTARVLERMVEAVVWRTYAQEGLEQMAAGTRIPIINGLSDDFHPCQLLADLLTIREHKGGTAGRIMTFIGDGRSNMGHSYLLGGATAGMHVRVVSPDGYLPREDVVEDARRIAADTGGSVLVGSDLVELTTGADIVVTDTWVSMGFEAEKQRRLEAFAGYRVTSEVMAHAADDAIFMHCLPADRGFEVDAEVIDGPQSVIFDEAENRLHAQKALLAWLLAKANDEAVVLRD